MILFTADWHIKLGQKNVPISWAQDRYCSFIEQVTSLGPDFHIIGGDIFDSLPSLEELAIFKHFISNNPIPTIAFSGNHEAVKKHTTFLGTVIDLLQDDAKSIMFADEPSKLTDFDDAFPEDWAILPYTHLKKKDWGCAEHANVLFTHVRGAIPPHVTPEVPLERFDKYKVVFAGDLHSHSNTQRNIVYPGSPMTTSFHRSKVKTGGLMIDETTGDWEWIEFKLPQLLRKRVSSAKDMVPTDYDHTIFELEGNMESLAKEDIDTTLLDKKIVKRATDASLLLPARMSLVEELKEYLEHVLELDRVDIDKVLGEFHNNVSAEEA